MKKLLVVAAAILSLSLASCSSDTEPVEVSGTTGVPAQTGDSFSDQGLTYTDNWTDVSDDRVAGPNEAVVFCEWISEAEESAACEGTLTIINDRGTWEGSFSGTSTKNVHDIRGDLLGSGDYEGLRFTYRLQGTEFPWSITGQIEPTDN